ncbi:MAG: universal stress protein [Acidimicrobiales bacterium]|jgi:nucleotide-binding universal stress UspA family protein|nr:universal stress protein [Acidimicrobiales bacterium]
MPDILACVDLSTAATEVLGAAAAIAAASGSRVHLLHVAASEPEIAGYDRGPVATWTRDDRAHELLDEHRELRETAQALAERGIEVVPLVAMGPTVASILKEARRIDALAIVVGTHGHGALHHLLLGSVAEHLIRASDRPVLVVPVRDR